MITLPASGAARGWRAGKSRSRKPTPPRARDTTHRSRTSSWKQSLQQASCQPIYGAAHKKPDKADEDPLPAGRRPREAVGQSHDRRDDACHRDCGSDRVEIARGELQTFLWTKLMR